MKTFDSRIFAVLGVKHNLRAALLLIAALLWIMATACSGGGEVTVDGDAACEEEGCPCIFAHTCPDGMQCVNGMCSSSSPLSDLRNGSEARGLDAVSGDNDDLAVLPGDATVGDVHYEQEFAEPCTNNEQCLSGWCVDSPDGGYCTKTCGESCPEGWVCKTITQTSPDYIEVCVQDKSRLCLPCETDLHCGDAGDLCLDIGGGSFCARDCSVEPCPTGYKCEPVDGEGGPQLQCLPLNDACDCSAANVGQVRGCQVSNDAGTCFGEETCDAVLGWVECTAGEPWPEECDGLDNNCNGQTDEGFSPDACTISNEHGVCSGTKTCQGGSGWVCSAHIPTAEKCNGLDDNCNVEIDDGFSTADGYYLDVENCGNCGNSCVAKFAGAAEVGCELVLDEETCVIHSCLPGYFLYNELTCMPEDAFLCQPCQQDSDCFGELSKCVTVSLTDQRTFCARDCSGNSEFSIECPGGYACEEVDDALLCMPVNDSCDCTETNSGQTKACSLQNDFGICFGNETCDPAVGWTGCTAVTPEMEICDGIDNDCDGMQDENTVDGTPCEAGNEFGTCSGNESCAGLEGVLCSAPVPGTETCDGQDNDCDGVTDEGFAISAGNPPVLKYGLMVEHCGTCGYQCPAVPNGSVVCDIVPETPVCKVGSCDQGHFDYLGAACLAVPDANLCTPCKSSEACQGPGDLCVMDGPEQGYCARDCSPGAIYETPGIACTGTAGEQGCCPDGYLCSDVDGSPQCLPLTGACSCVEEGALDGCSIANDLGTCMGVRTCTLQGDSPGWSECDAPAPSEEICDGDDNDCDGLIDGKDDSLVYTTTPSGDADCQNGPACTGKWLCNGGDWTCNAQAAKDELCDGFDNNCDGDIDEDFLTNGLYISPLHCGACGYDCKQLIPNSLDPTCELVGNSPTCLAQECEAGHFPYGGGTVCLVLPDNLCQPCSSDADCLVPSSKCVTAGVEKFCGRNCAPDGPFGPDCPAGYTCQAVGDSQQCVPASQSCVCGPDTVGLSRSCDVDSCIGLQVCQESGAGYAFTPCDAEGVVTEVCDGIDNDCDGTVDEGFAGPNGTYTDDENCGVCGNNCLVQVSVAVHHAVGGCDTQAVPPECYIAECTTTTSDGQLFDWVDVNGVLDDGCECRRVAGNTDDDLPELHFFADDGVTPVHPTAGAEYLDDNCDGLDGVVGDALFVSAANPLPGDGSLDSPFRTIGEALAVFLASGKEYILVSGGVYEENVQLYAGAVLHGGYAPGFLSRDIVLFATEIRGQQPDFADPAAPQGTVSADGITGAKTVLSGFVVTGYDVTATGADGLSENSYAIYVVDSSDDLVLTNNWVIGGYGSNGKGGDSGTAGFGTQSPGGGVLNGGNGANASGCINGNCGNQSSAGGNAGTNANCVSASGPPGGGVTCPIYNQASYTPANPGHDGDPGYSWTLDSWSSGSCGSHATEAGYPTDIKKMDGGEGSEGQTGVSGVQGTGCGGAGGTLVDGHWAGQPGAPGNPGNFGQPGGAGGSSGGVDSASAAEMPAGVGAYGGSRYMLGATGGGSGAGGCGGGGGKGGNPGGASVAISVAWSGNIPPEAPPIITGNLVQRGFGGNGGGGGFGGDGGSGGDGGAGGDSGNYWIDFRAGDGGRGGKGGTGGGGGGGCGGASFGIALFSHPKDWDVTYAADNEFAIDEALSTGGTGGQAGPSGLANPDGDGAEGLTKNFHSSPAP